VLRLSADFRREQTAHENPYAAVAHGPSQSHTSSTASIEGPSSPKAASSLGPCPVRAEGAIEECALTFLPRQYCQRLEGFVSDARSLIASSLAEARTEVIEALTALRASRISLDHLSPSELAESDHAARKIQASFRLHIARKQGPRGRPPRSGAVVRPNHAAATAPTTLQKFFANCALLAQEVVTRFGQPEANALLEVCQPEGSGSAASGAGTRETPRSHADDAHALHTCMQYLRQMRVLDVPTHASVSDLAASITHLRAQDAAIEASLQRYIARSMLVPSPADGGEDAQVHQGLSPEGLARLRSIVFQRAVAFRLVRRADIEERWRRQQDTAAQASAGVDSLFASEDALLRAVERLRDDAMQQLCDALSPLYRAGGSSPSPSSLVAPRILESLWIAGGGCAHCLVSFFMPAVAANHRAQQRQLLQQEQEASKKQQKKTKKDGNTDASDNSPPPRAQLSVLELSVRCAAFRTMLIRSAASISSALRRLNMLPTPADPARFTLDAPLDPAHPVEAWQCCDLPSAEPHAHAPLLDEPLSLGSEQRLEPPFASAPTLAALVRFDAKLSSPAGRSLRLSSVVELLERFHAREAKQRTVNASAPVFTDEAQLLLAVHQTLVPPRPAAAVPVPAPATPKATPAAAAAAEAVASPTTATTQPEQPQAAAAAPASVPVESMTLEELELKKAQAAAELAAADAALAAAEKKRAAAEAKRAAALAQREADLAQLTVRQRVAAEREAAALKIQSLQRGRSARQAASVRRAMRDRLRMEAEAEAEAQRKHERRLKRRTMKASVDEQLKNMRHGSAGDGVVAAEAVCVIGEAVSGQSSIKADSSSAHARPIVARQVSAERFDEALAEEVIGPIDAALAVAASSPSLAPSSKHASPRQRGSAGGSVAASPEVRWMVQVDTPSATPLGGPGMLTAAAAKGAEMLLASPPLEEEEAHDAPNVAAAVLVDAGVAVEQQNQQQQAADEDDEPLIEVAEAEEPGAAS